MPQSVKGYGQVQAQRLLSKPFPDIGLDGGPVPPAVLGRDGCPDIAAEHSAQRRGEEVMSIELRKVVERIPAAVQVAGAIGALDGRTYRAARSAGEGKCVVFESFVSLCDQRRIKIGDDQVGEGRGFYSSAVAVDEEYGIGRGLSDLVLSFQQPLFEVIFQLNRSWLRPGIHGSYRMIVIVDGNGYENGCPDEEKDIICFSPQADADEQGEQQDISNDPGKKDRQA